jgi:hypothetical protein
MRNSGFRRRCAVALAAGLSFAGAASAGVTVTIDRATLDDLLTAVAAQEVAVPIAENRSIDVRLDELKVLGLVPADGEGQNGHLRTAVELQVPELGLTLAAEPRVSLRAADSPSGSVIELRFEELPLRLPLAGAINVAPLLPVIRFPADNVWLVTGASGDVEVESRLVDVEIQREAIRFAFEIEVEP